MPTSPAAQQAQQWTPQVKNLYLFAQLCGAEPCRAQRLVCLALAKRGGKAGLPSRQCMLPLYRWVWQQCLPQPESCPALGSPLLDALARLPRRRRAAAGLCITAGLGCGEIAQVLDLPPEAVQQGLGQDLPQLRAALTH